MFEKVFPDLRVLLRLLEGRKGQPTAAFLDRRTVQGSVESGERTGYDGYKRRKGSKVHAAVDTLGNLLALHVTPADEQDRSQVGELTAAVQEGAGENVEVAFVDQGYAGENAAEDSALNGVRLEVVKHTEAKKGFVLLLRRWAVKRFFGWATRFRRLVRNYERLPTTVAGLRFIAYVGLMLSRILSITTPQNA